MTAPNFKGLMLQQLECHALNQLFAAIKYDATGRIVAVTSEVTRTLGYNSLELAGKSRARLCPSAIERSSACPVRGAIRSGRVQRVAENCVSKDGRSVLLMSRYVPVTDASGIPYGVLQIISNEEHQQCRAELPAVSAAPCYECELQLALEKLVQQSSNMDLREDFLAFLSAAASRWESARAWPRVLMDGVEEARTSDLKRINEMRRGLDEGQFLLEYQPRFDTETCRILSAEALVRWEHPLRGRISPAEFIPLAEESGMIVALGDWVLKTACAAAVNWGSVGVSVNVSPVQFREANFVEAVRHHLIASGLPPGRLELEITEGVLLADVARAVEILTNLKKLGVKLAMDDFGTGYSSLSYLRKFPFDVIKIDRSFVKDLGAETCARPIVQAIIGLGKALDLRVTAEGVETDLQLAILRADRCDEVQGYLLSRPTNRAGVAEISRRRIGASVPMLRKVARAS